MTSQAWLGPAGNASPKPLAGPLAGRQFLWHDDCYQSVTGDCRAQFETDAAGAAISNPAAYPFQTGGKISNQTEAGALEPLAAFVGDAAAAVRPGGMPPRPLRRAELASVHKVTLELRPAGRESAGQNETAVVG